MIDTVAVAEWRVVGRHFAPAVCAAVVWFLLCAIGFNLIDPYGVIDWPVVAGFNDVKPSRYANARIYKPVSFLRGDYNGIILGGSRELLGMDPHNAILSSNGRRFYNFALVEERTYEAAQIIEFAVVHRAISTVVIDLDFTRYNLDPPLLAGPQPFYPKGRSILPWALGQDALAAVSPRGLGDSFDTLLASRERRLLARRHTPGGLEENPGRSPDLQYPYEARFSF